MINEVNIILPGIGELEIDSSITIPLNFQWEDLTNPTAIINTFSKTVSVPASAKNDKVFDHIYNFDHLIYQFDPSKRTDFVLTVNGDIVTSGYFKLKNVDTLNNRPQNYNIELFGGVGDFFYNLSTKSMKELEVNPDNYNHNINKEAVRDSWSSEYYCYPLTYSGLYDNFDSDKVFSGFSDNSIFGQILDSIEHEGKFYGIFSGGIITYTPADGTGVLIPSPEGLVSTANRIVYDGVVDRFLAWDNTDGAAPYVYYTNGTTLTLWERIAIADDTGGPNAIRDVYCNASAYNDSFRYFVLTQRGFLSWRAGLTGALSEVQLNNYAFRYSRILLSSPGVNFPAVYATCFGDSDADSNTKVYYVNTGNSNSTPIVTSTSFQQAAALIGSQLVLAVNNTLTWGQGTGTYTTVTLSGLINEITSLTDGVVTGSGDGLTYIGRGVAGSNHIGITYSPLIGLSAYVLPDSTGTVGSYQTISFSRTTENYVAFGQLNGNIVLRYGFDTQNLNDWGTVVGFYDSIDDENTKYNEHQRNEYRSYYQRPMLRVKYLFEQILIDSGFDYSLDETFFHDNNPYWDKTWIIMGRLQHDGDVPPVNKVGNIRSDDPVTYSMMMTSGSTQFEFFLSYIKQFGLIVEKDAIQKKISISTRNTYFSNYQTLDWNEKIDYSRQGKIEPITFTFRYGVMKYADAGSYYEDLYSEKNGIDYGSVRVDTGYGFDNSEKVFLESIFQNVVMSREYDREFAGRNTGDDYADDKILPALFNVSSDEMSYNDSGMHLVFRDGNYTLETPIRITDDNPSMLTLGLYMWTIVADDGINASSIPNVTRVLNEAYSLDFAKPGTLYYTTTSNYPDNIGVYDKFWNRYIEEIYNKNNQVITNYFNLSNIDISLFQHKNFIVVNNALFFVNKITDYNINDDNTTKVELVRVYDLTAYTEGQELPANTHDFYLNLDLSGFPSVIPQEGGNYQIRIQTNADWEIEHINTNTYNDVN